MKTRQPGENIDFPVIAIMNLKMLSLQETFIENRFYLREKVFVSSYQTEIREIKQLNQARDSA